MSLFSEFDLGPTHLSNHIVMAPMTRSRAVGNVPNELMAQYYAQRASTGLIVTEGVSPSPNGLGYPRIPGLYSAEQIAGWTLVTDAVHAKGGKIFAQIMHVGRIGHPLNLPAGGELVAPSAVAAEGQMYTDQEGMKAHPTPREMTEDDIAKAQAEFVTAAKNAIKAGFDGVELHAANGYLLTQFLNPKSNRRTDGYGGSIENRNRFVVETAEAVTAAIGAGRVGIRFSPHGTFNDMADYEETPAQFAALAAEMKRIGLVYVHVVTNFGGVAIPQATTDAIRASYDGTLILNGGFYDRASAEAALAGAADLIAIGVPFIANPDLVDRLESGAELASPNQELFYAPGPEGYVDYPAVA